MTNVESQMTKEARNPKSQIDASSSASARPDLPTPNFHLPTLPEGSPSSASTLIANRRSMLRVVKRSRQEPRKTRNTRKAERISNRRPQRDRCPCCPARTTRFASPMSEDERRLVFPSSSDCQEHEWALIDEDGRGGKEFGRARPSITSTSTAKAEYEYECKVRARARNRNRRSATEAVRGSMLALRQELGSALRASVLRCSRNPGLRLARSSHRLHPGLD